MQQRLSGSLRVFLAFLAFDCALKLWAVVGLFIGPERLPDFPTLQKAMKMPEVLLGMLVLTVPSLMIVAVPRWRSVPRLFVVSGVLVALTLASLIMDLFVLTQVGSVALYGFACAEVWRMAEREYAQQVAEPDAGERNASSCSRSGAG